MMTNQKDRECCICLDEFKTPRVLPCIHTFCEECLHTHISQCYKTHQLYEYKWTSFPCPLCRHACTLPELKLNTTIEELVRKYPTNYYINLKTCAKHESTVFNMACMTSGIDMCGVCITDGHNGCDVFIRRNAKKDAIETLVDVFNGIIEAASLWKKGGPRFEAKTNEKHKERVEEKRFIYRCQKYIRLEKRMAMLQQSALEMQEKISKVISAISASQNYYIFSNDVGNANRLKNQLLETFEKLQIHAKKSGKCQCLLLSEFNSKLNLANNNETELEENTSKEATCPEEISYFFLTHKNQTQCRKLVNIKVLQDCSVIILCLIPHKIVKLSWCGEFISELLFSNQPSDMCLKEDGEIAVSFSYRRRIDFVDVSGSQLQVTISFETLRPYQKIATCGPTGLLACHSERIDLLKKFNNSLNIVKNISLFDYIFTLDSIDDVIVFSTYDKTYTYSYDIRNDRLGIYYLPLTVDQPLVDISCSSDKMYFLFAELHCVYRMKIPPRKFDESTGYLLLKIGKPHKIHVNNARLMAVCSTNRNADRFLVQIFKC